MKGTCDNEFDDRYYSSGYEVNEFSMMDEHRVIDLLGALTSFYRYSGPDAFR